MTLTLPVRMIPLAVLLGLALGFLFPKPAEAVTIAYVFNHQGGDGNLTCGWHGSGSACPGGSNQALDWDNGDNATVWWRSWTVNDYSGSAITTGQMITYNSSGTCTAVTAEIRDIYGTYKGAVAYKHTAWISRSINLTGDPDGNWQTASIGTSVTSDTCEMTGSHVHQHSAGGFVTHDHNPPDYYPTDSTCPGSDCGVLSNRHTYHYHMLWHSFAFP